MPTGLEKLKARIRKNTTLEFSDNWVEIGGHEEGDKRHVGGTPVQLNKEGRIVKGPEGLVGHKPDAIPPKHRQEQIKKIISNRQQSPMQATKSKLAGMNEPTTEQPSRPPEPELSADEHEAKSEEHYGKSLEALNRGDMAGHATHRDAGNHHSDEAERKRGEQGHEQLASKHHAVADAMEKAAEGHPQAETVKKQAGKLRAKGDEYKAKAGLPITTDDLHKQYESLKSSISGKSVEDLRNEFDQKFGGLSKSEAINLARKVGYNITSKAEAINHLRGTLEGLKIAGVRNDVIRGGHHPPLTPDALMQEFNDLHPKAGPQGLPIHQLREHIAQKYGPQAASHETLDPMLKGLRGKKLRLTSGGESVAARHSGEQAMTPQQMEAGIPGATDPYASGPAEVFTHLNPHTR